MRKSWAVFGVNGKSVGREDFFDPPEDLTNHFGCHLVAAELVSAVPYPDLRSGSATRRPPMATPNVMSQIACVCQHLQRDVDSYILLKIKRRVA
jgi:hypothetical protein